jgi:hypothetical protein
VRFIAVHPQSVVHTPMLVDILSSSQAVPVIFTL